MSISTTIDAAAIPAELAERPQWVCWKTIIKKGKPAKVPFQPDGREAKSNDPATWTTLTTALAASPSFEGIGYVFDAADPYVGIDLDGCRDPETGSIAEWASPIIADFPTYAEVSPSGSGIKLFCRGKLPEGYRHRWKVEAPAIGGKTAGVEAYERLRYFTFTGRRLNGCNAELQDCQAAIDRLLAGHKKPQPPPRPIQSFAVPHDRQFTIRRAAAYVATIEGAVSGNNGHGATFHVACTLILGFDLSQEEAWPIISTWNAKCVPEWSEHDLRRKLAEADKQADQRGYLLPKERSGFAPAYTNGRTKMIVRTTSKGHQASDENQIGQDDDDGPDFDQINTALAGETGDEAPVTTSRELPTVALHGGSITITSSAQNLGRLLAPTKLVYVRGGVVTWLDRASEHGLSLKTVKPAAFASDIEKVAKLVRAQQTKTGEQLVPANCSESAAKLILESAAIREVLPKLTLLSPCPVLVERDHELITVVGYDAPTGILAEGKQPELLAVQDAVGLLADLLHEFRFASPGDRARALAAFITPALVFGNLLGARAPVDLGEANESQSGKGFRNKITAAIYNVMPHVVSQRTGGVGSLQETFDGALIRGATIISLDNLRGKLDVPAIESFLTETNYTARAPYQPQVEIDPRRVILMLTSNRAEMTVDMANRSSCVRILKQTPGYQFRKYTVVIEGKKKAGDLLDHVQANQPRYLGAVFAVVREWHRQGQPQLDVARHDFRQWARVLGWISENILGAGDLLAAHHEAQQRIASPSLLWLRDVCLAVQRADRLNFWLRANQILQLVVEHAIETPGIDLAADLDDETEFLKSARKIGLKLSKLFTTETITLDQFTVERSRRSDDSFREVTEYAFSSETPKSPK